VQLGVDPLALGRRRAEQWRRGGGAGVQGGGSDVGGEEWTAAAMTFPAAPAHP